MEIIASIIQIIPNLCTGISKQTGYVRHLKNNVDALMGEATRLRALCADIENAGREASGGRQKLTSQAVTCLDQARPILAEIDDIKSQFDQRPTFCNGCSPYLCSDYTLGKRAFKKLEPVRQFIEDGSGIQLLDMSSSPSVVKRDVRDLMAEAEMLNAKCDDMESEGREASRKRMRLTKQAQIWLGHARAILTEIAKIKSEFDGIFLNLPSTSTLGARAFQKLEPVRRLINERSSIQLVAMSSPPRVMEMDDVPTVGQSSAQQTMVKIWDLLHDEHTSVIWIYGMGGIGKTTLMKAINNKLKAASEFDYVIWVTLSKQHDSQKIQKDIMSRLHLKFDEDSDSDRSRQLRQYLTDRRYMLILDDLWDPINLSAIGIPANKENRSKIAITSRNAKMSVVQVCSDMKAEMIRVEPLTEDEAWDLFAAKVGKEVVLLPIKNVAKEVARECGGLPLAIVVVAKAMEGESSEALWRNTLRALKASAPKIGDMEDQVFLPLKLSYDDLKDEEVKKCFLYCSLFPEDYEIPVKQLIRWWIMEGFIDSVNDLVDKSDEGVSIIEKLKRRCLLEERIRPDGNFVKMHDVIRDVALYIASSSGPKFLVRAKEGLNEPPAEGSWREFGRISLMMNDITELPVNPECPNLISLFLNNNPIIAVPHSFFELMRALQFLDLSYTSIASLSVSSSSLLNLRALILRGCRRLTEVPLLGQLKELQFLDIKSSGIISLPKEMQNLVKLKKLNMSGLFSYSLTIPSNVMSGLSSLEDLRMHRTNVNWAKDSEFAVQNDDTLGEGGKLKRLTILKIAIKDFGCVEDNVFLLQLPKLKRFKILIGPSNENLNLINCVKQVYISGGDNYPPGAGVMVTHTEGLKLFAVGVTDVSQLVGVANGLRMLDIEGCGKLECILDWSKVGGNALQNIEELRLSLLTSLQKLFKGEVPRRCLQNLNKIYLNNCYILKGLFTSEMAQNLDQLHTLDVRDCKGLKEIIEGHDKSLPKNPFPQLRNITLKGLFNLESIICHDTLALPSLIKLQIDRCRKLRLPKRPDTTDWPSITHGNARWQANPQYSEHMQRPNEE